MPKRPGREQPSAYPWIMAAVGEGVIQVLGRVVERNPLLRMLSGGGELAGA